jgi:hypothetical protein
MWSIDVHRHISGTELSIDADAAWTETNERDLVC